MRFLMRPSITVLIALTVVTGMLWRFAEAGPFTEERPASLAGNALMDGEPAAQAAQFGQGAAANPQPIDEDRRNAIVRAIEHAGPAVVTINVISIERQRVFDPFYFDFFDPFGLPRRGYRTRERRVEGIGTGFFFDNQGHILTNFHVIQNAHDLTVSLPDGRTLDVELVGADETTDLAVLRAQGGSFPSLPLGDSENLYIGEWVVAIGNPFGTLMNDPQPSVSVGVVSATNRRVVPQAARRDRLYQDMIQTDAAINPGNSGGPLVNARGEAIGVNTMIFSQSGGNVGLGFAIPIERARRVAEEIIEFGRRRNPWAGFQVEDVRQLDRRFLLERGIRAEEGCLVISVLQSSPAYHAGLRTGDVIKEINGRPVIHPSDVDYAIWSLFEGDQVALEVDRQGQRITIEFEIRELRQAA